MFKILAKFRQSSTNHQYPLMRAPDFQPKCYDMTEQERLDCIREWNNRNVWNDPTLANEDELNFYQGA